MNFESIKINYDKELWNKNMVKTAVRKGVISIAEYEQITGEFYTPRILRASQDYEPGEYFIIDNVMYKTLLPILTGSQLTIGTNIEPTTVENELQKLKQEDN